MQFPLIFVYTHIQYTPFRQHPPDLQFEQRSQWIKGPAF